MSTIRSALAALLLALSLAACGAEKAGDDSGVNEFDCPEGSCVSDPTPSSSPGDTCTADADCTAGIDPRCVLSTQGWPGGVCVSSCSEAVGGAAACPDDAVCVTFDDDLRWSLCLGRCAGNADCRPEYYCQAMGDTSFCMARCDRSSTACAKGYVCDPDSGACVEDPGSPGEACATSADCTVGVDPRCWPPTQGWPDGMCVSSCADAVRGARDCPDHTVCVIFDEDIESSRCVQRCADDSDCRPEYYCKPVGDTGFCMARCTESPVSCAAGHICDANSSACIEDIGAGPEVKAIDLGRVKVTPGFEFGSFQFDITEDVVSFTIVVTTEGGGISMPFRILAPSGREVFYVNRMGSSEVKVSLDGPSFAVLYPNSPRLAMEAGRWQFTLGNLDGGGTARVRVLLKHGPGGISTGTIDVNAFIVTDDFGEDANENEQFQAVIRSFEDVWVSAGLSVGKINVVPVGNADRVRWSTIDSVDGTESEFRQMIRGLSGGAPAPGLNVFFVDAIEAGESGYTILGIAGGIPGIPLVPGTDTSGVVVSTVMLDPHFGGGPTSVARTLAHEAGHWLGLYHTSERTGTEHDPLDDTVECLDIDGSGFIDSQKCSDSGAEYLMFWESNIRGNVVTPDQTYVVLRNPEVR